jgi:hypothetical protein
MTKAEAELLELMRASGRARICGLSPRSRWKRVPTRVPGRASDFVREVYPEEAKEPQQPSLATILLAPNP